jgi:thioredoxin 1
MRSSRFTVVLLVIAAVVAVLVAKARIQTRGPQLPTAPLSDRISLSDKPATDTSADPESPPQMPSPPVPAAAREPKADDPLPGSQLDACLKSGRPTLADFGMGTCKPCQAMAPILKQAARDYWGKANIVFVELDKYPDLGRKYGIAVMPTQIFFDSSGTQVESHMGFMDRAGIDGRLTTLGAQQ